MGSPAHFSEPVQFKRPGDDVNGSMAPADLGILEQVDLAIRRGADESGIAIENELLAGQHTGDDAKPAGAGDDFDPTGPWLRLDEAFC